MAIHIKVIVFLGVMVASSILVYAVRNHALKKGILDMPNARSSHKIATPRGGGLGFVIPFLFSIIVLGFFNLLSVSISFALIGGGTLVAVLGWLDDKSGLTARVRAVFQFLAATWAVFWLGGFSTMSIGFAELQLSWIGSIVAVIGTVWMINLYNFMDGIDGIAGSEAVSVAVICGLLLLWQQSSGLAAVIFLFAASVLGFLVWNWPPAKIFMGDVGSAFLGFIFAVMAMWSEQSGAVPLIIWIMLLGVFVIDATITLIKRLGRGEKLYEAHRSHVYQLAVQAGYSHKQVTSTVLLINLLLGIIAVVALTYSNYLLGISIGTAILLIVVHIMLGNRFNAKINEMKAAGETGDRVVKQSYSEAAGLEDE